MLRLARKINLNEKQLYRGKMFVDKVFIRRPIPEENYVNDIPTINYLKKHELKFTTPVRMTKRIIENPKSIFDNLFD